jgi:ABC-type antimicrobial peptide transport system permease subunit
MALHERRREFSVLVAIGTERLRLYTTYILEILFLLFPGMALGTLLGMGMGAYFEYYPIVLSGEEAEAFSASGFVPKIKAIVAADELIIGILTIIIPILILCMVAARRIYKLKPVQEINEK